MPAVTLMHTTQQCTKQDPLEDLMGTSGNPAIRSVSSAADFKKKKGGVFELPSGVTVRLKNPGGLRLFLTEGMIPNSLMSTVNGALEKGKKMEPTDFVKDGKVDQAVMDEMMTLLDNITMRCIVEPKVHPTPSDDDLRVWNEAHPSTQLDDPDELRDDSLVYVDEIDEQDKMFIFQWVTGGTSDLETFRRESDQSLADVGRSATVGSTPKRVARAAKG